MLSLISVLCTVMAVTRVSDAAPSISRTQQYVKPIPGFIPVYIRPGDTPLEDINPDLAEAFKIHERKHGRFDLGRSTKNLDSGKIDIAEVEFSKEDNQIISSKKPKETIINLNDLSLGVPVAISLPEVPTYFHIQKIPKKYPS